MEKLPERNEKIDQGSNASESFRGNAESVASREVYGESAKLFSDILRSKLPEGDYSLVDLGSFKGELLGEVLKNLPNHHFSTIAVDYNMDALKENSVANSKVQAELINIPMQPKSVDVAMMRYALQWNSSENQKLILSEINKIVKKFAIIQHAGSDDSDPQGWRSKGERIFNDPSLPELKRAGMHFSSPAEIEEMMNDLEIKFEKVDEKRIENLSDIYCQKYKLDDKKCERVKELFDAKDFVVRTTWIMYGNEPS